MRSSRGARDLNFTTLHESNIAQRHAPVIARACKTRACCRGSAPAMPREVEEWRQSVRDPFDRALDTIEPSPYAPKWVRAAHDAKRTDDSAAFELDEPSPLGAPPARTNTSEGIVIDRIRIPRSLEPTLMPPPAFESRSFLRLSLVFGVAVGIATVAAFVVVGKPWSGKTSSAETAKVLAVAYTEPAPVVGA